MEEWRCDPLILNLSTERKLAVSSNRGEEAHGNILNRELVGSKEQTGCFGEEKKLLPLLELEPRVVVIVIINLLKPNDIYIQGVSRL